MENKDSNSERKTMQDLYRNYFAKTANRYIQRGEMFEQGGMDSWSGRVKFHQTLEQKDLLVKLKLVYRKINDKDYVKEFIQENCPNLNDLYEKWKATNPKYDGFRLIPKASEILNQIVSIRNLNHIANDDEELAVHCIG